MPKGNGIPGPLDAIAYVHINLFGNGEMSISGNIGDAKLAKQMLDHARDTIAARLQPKAGGVIIPARDVEVVPSAGFPLVPHGDVDPSLRPVLDMP